MGLSSGLGGLASGGKGVLRSLLLSLASAVSRVRLLGVDKVGRGVRVRGRLLVENRGTMYLGQNVRIWSHVARTQLSTGPGAVLEIGDDTFINCGTTISARRRVSIGSRVQIANLVTIMDSDFHGIEERGCPPPPEEVVIEDDAWIAAKATVLKGVRVGRGSVVGAGAVVTRDVAPYTFVAGVPARLVRSIPCKESSAS